MAAITIGLFVYFKKKQWILAGSDALSSSTDMTSGNGRRNKSTSSNNTIVGNMRESFEGDKDSKDKRNENNLTTNFLNPSDAVANGSANKMQRAEK